MRRIVLSRKGFDSSSGGRANPILDDGTMMPLPIPDRASPIRYGDVRLHGYDLGALLADLTGDERWPGWGAHLDPDLVRSAYPRRPGWRPLFGQAGAAQGHLENHGVGPGDLFLFFGWFRRGREDLHALWGWLYVDRVIRIGEDPVPAWAAYHPHCFGDRPKNTLYVARRGPGGAGVFRHYDESLRLTAPGATRSRWRLPGWFAPRDGASPLSAHGLKRWSTAGGWSRLESVPRGQEFVLDAKRWPEAIGWARDLIDGAASSASQSSRG